MVSHIGNRLKALRHSQRFTQEYVAEQTGLTQSVYNRLENNKRSLNVEELQVVCEFFHIEPNHFLAQPDEDPIITYMRKDAELSEKALHELKAIISMINDANGQMELQQL